MRHHGAQAGEQKSQEAVIEEREAREFGLRGRGFFCISLRFMWIRQNGVPECRSGEAPATGKQVGRAAMWLALLFMAALAGGCRKSAPAPSPLPPPSPETIARVRWLGKQRLAADTNAASLMGIWNLAESKQLEAQTLDRLAVGLLATNGASVISNQFLVTGLQSPITNHQTVVTNCQSRLSGLPALLRPLLEDLLQQESFVEVRQVTNQPGDLVLAIRLQDERARLWETNVAQLVESLTGSRPLSAPGRTNGWRWSVTSHQSPITRQIELARVGEWTVVALGQQTNALTTEFYGLIQNTGMPFPRQPKDFWLYGEVDLRRVTSALSLDWELPAELPRISLGVSGDGQTVRTRGQLDFSKPLPADLGQWNIPTNLIHDPLTSFTALRGIGPWLFSQKLWQNLSAGAPPGQLYFWAENGLPFLSFGVARLPNASNQLSQLAGRLVQLANPWLATNSQGAFARLTNGNGVAWKDLPLVEPFIESMPGGADDMVYGGLVRDIGTNWPPAALFAQITSPTNLVAYDWEMTGTRVVQWLYFGQFFRLFLHLAQVPAHSPSVAWLQALEFKLGNCVSAVMRTGPAQLSLMRQSTVGLNSVELHLLADWLESPQFPRGLHTFRAPPETALVKKPAHRDGGTRTNSVPPPRR